MSSRYDDGSKKYLFCDPWNGSKVDKTKFLKCRDYLLTKA